MNIAPLRRIIFKELAIFGVVVTFLGAGVWYLGNVRDEISKQNAEVVSETQKILAIKDDTYKKFTSVKDSINIYDESNKHAVDPGLFIDSQAVRDLFNHYQSIFFLRKMSVDMQPITDVAGDPKFIRQHFVGTKTTARVSLEATSDEDIYNLIHVMQKELPGFISITSLSIRKPGVLSQDILSQMRKNGAVSVIIAEFNFDWYGLRASEADNTINNYVPKNRESWTP